MLQVCRPSGLAVEVHHKIPILKKRRLLTKLKTGIKGLPKTVVSKSPGANDSPPHTLAHGQAGYSTSSAQKLSPGIYWGQENRHENTMLLRKTQRRIQIPDDWHAGILQMFL